MTHHEAQVLLTQLDPQAILPAEDKMISPFNGLYRGGAPDTTTLADYLVNAFNWDETPQYHGYWRNLHQLATAKGL